MDRAHVPVLEREVVAWMHCREGGVYVDATVGSGGHAAALLNSCPGIALLVGIDRDAQAAALARKNLAAFHDRAVITQGNFADIKQILSSMHVHDLDGILFDLGVSSMQLEDPLRGFSFKSQGPLDMRMDQDSALTAYALVNTSAVSELEHVLRTYGEERWARKIARTIVKRREQSPVTTTGELAQLVSDAIPSRHHPRTIDPATKTFQALRIAVNSELDNITRALDDAIGLLKKSGRLCVISFHSLEDRIIKQKMQLWEKSCICPPRLPRCMCGKIPVAAILTKKPLIPSADELAANPRSRSAKLRVAERV
jgi:16S rRNA (cytosine1402-N4)-methyltransferase